MIDPDIARFVADSDRFYPSDTAQRPLNDQRRLYEAYASTFAVQRPSGITSHDDALVLADRLIPLRLYRPGRTLVDGVVVYAHGGGFVLGSLDSHDGIVARIADAAGAPVVAVDYRLAPEHPHPAALDDVLAVAKAVLERRSPWEGLLPTRLVLMGDSAGGTLACAAALRLGQAWPDRLRALALIYPSLGFEPAEPARTRWAEAPMLTLDDVRLYRSAYLGRDGDPSPFPLDQPDLSALPPTVLLPAEVDPLRDDCTMLAGRLQALGTEVMLLPGTGLVHGALRAMDRAAAMAEPFARMCAFLSARLGA
ncbi:alpha/beta hydrolase [Lichenihabitans sp. Uapishka_5]|uniref:alpha/beta hydrolase n=1 Tax=Lichenihabitans sp. Uapishka_5 TaxID=3037302 RepID=UPI0029E807D9|nr:alpha/beta hydrolase [Lichenihabitans sp. Uapishka_5]MDX7951835.1 alpha/beta hydrolase [Lichenihabitans sp. Uapishka_5]